MCGGGLGCKPSRNTWAGRARSESVGLPPPTFQEDPGRAGSPVPGCQGDPDVEGGTGLHHCRALELQLLSFTSPSLTTRKLV